MMEESPKVKTPLPGGEKKWVEELELVALSVTISETEQLGLKQMNATVAATSFR